MSVVNMSPLTSCAKWHPGEASDIRLCHGVGPKGKPFMRRHCAVCRGLYARRRYQRDTRPIALEPYGPAMGVMRLNWAPPEMQQATP